jgi:hypothetical protein
MVIFMDDNKIRRAIATRLALPLTPAGRALGLGRRKTREEANAGRIPTTPSNTVPTSWLRQVLLLDRDDGPQAT